MRVMKNSNIQWIGEIPDNWNLNKIGAIYEERNIKVSDAEYEPLSVTKNGIVPQLDTAAKTDNGDNRKLIRKNDFVINSRSDRRGACGISERDGSCSLINTVLRPRKEVINEYFNYVFKTDCFADEFYRWGHGIVNDLWTTKWTDMKNIYIPFPDLHEQQSIALYLNSKCQIIDDAISKHEEIIERLKEYRLSLITETLINGLEPQPEMVYSGIVPIGDISSKAHLKKLKYIAEITDGTHDTPAYVDESDFSYPLVTSKSIINGHIDISLANHISREDYEAINYRSNVNKYDIIMPMIGTVGNPAIVDIEPNFAIKNVALIRTKGNLVLSKYIFYFLSSLCVIRQFDYLNRGGVQSFISQEQIKNLVFIEHNNINEIVEYLDIATTSIDKDINMRMMLVELLKQYKSSLIYEVVTGKRELSL